MQSCGQPIPNRILTSPSGTDVPTSCPPLTTQGLRSCTQVIGSLVSLSMLSPRLTLMLAVVTPALMGVGTLMGSGLRKLSRQCQEQVLEFLTCPPWFFPASLAHSPCPSFCLFLSTTTSYFPVSMQIARATGVADEALGNVRTVRAFAMEKREEE